MTEAEKNNKFLNYAGLEHVLEKLIGMSVNGDKGLVSKAKLDEITTRLSQVATSENLTTLQGKVTELEGLIEADQDGAINKLKEIFSFLNGLSDDSTLQGLLADIATQVGGKVDKVDGMGLSTNDYSNADKAAVQTIGNKVDKVDGKGLSTNDYTDAAKEAVATIGNKANSADVYSKTETYSKTDADATFVKQSDMTAITELELDDLLG